MFADSGRPMLPDPLDGPDLNALRELTPRERQIYLHLARGLANTEIAGRAHLSENTVRTHVSAILRKLALANRAQVVGHAHRHRLVPDGTSAGAPEAATRSAERSLPAER